MDGGKKAGREGERERKREREREREYNFTECHFTTTHLSTFFSLINIHCPYRYTVHVHVYNILEKMWSIKILERP